MLCRRTCFDKRALQYISLILSNSSFKKGAVPKSNCPRELPILKKWLRNRILDPKNRYSEKIIDARK